MQTSQAQAQAQAQAQHSWDVTIRYLQNFRPTNQNSPFSLPLSLILSADRGLVNRSDDCLEGEGGFDRV